jgi:hypothetical protein
MIKKIFEWVIGVILFLIVFPFIVLYYLFLLFWKMFGMSILGFLVVGLFGGTTDECLEYGASLGFFIGLILSIKK